MPRVAGQPATKSRNGNRQIMATPHKQSPVKFAMNDDRGEKVARQQSRQALQEIHMNEIRAVASPMRKINQNNHTRAVSSSPQTPKSHAAGLRRKAAIGEDTNQGSPGALNVVSGSAVTPMKRVPILANFEEWMKMATDNKINAANSWNFALIDYFHDMSLLKEGDGVNFQKASCTLDGCVKIYTSRVDSVATETGRLLSGLADSAEGKSKKNRDDAEGEEDNEGEEGDEEEEGEDGTKKKSRKKATRSHEATLAPSFASLQLKKLELEFAVDPLFKKASADFDEGGAKGLLLNHLSIDSEGRIVFDSSDDANNATHNTEATTEQQDGEDEAQKSDPIEKDAIDIEEDLDLNALATKFFPDLSILDNQDICPSMKDFTLGSSDLTLPFLKAPDDWRDADKAKKGASLDLDPNLKLADQTGIFLDGSNAMGFDDEEDGDVLGGFDIPDNVGFGEGGEAWAKDAALEPMMRVAVMDDGSTPLDDNLIEGTNSDEYAVSLQHRYREDAEHESIMAYFDKAFNSRAKGKNAFMSLENWRIQKIQKARQSEVAPTRQRKEKEPFEIDFLGPMSDSLKDLLEAPPVSNSTISLPKAQRRTKGRNLLEKDDEIVDARKLMKLWIKPKCRIGRRKGEMAVIDEGFGARGKTGGHNNDNEEEEDLGPKGDYDANFFADDEQILPFDIPLPIDDDDDEDGDVDGIQGFMDAREMLSPQPEGHRNIDGIDNGNEMQSLNSQLPSSSQIDAQPGSFGSQLVTQAGKRMRPEYVNYARTAKKVDVRRLKENMWNGMSDLLTLNPKAISQDVIPDLSTDHDNGDGDIDMMDIDSEGPHTPPPAAAAAVPTEEDKNKNKDSDLKFTQMIDGLRNVYPEQQMKDISTSYCFICLLHLANEKGLVLEGDRDAMQEIRVRRDESVGDGYEGE